MKIDHIDINEYDYNLDEGRIAKYPNEKRDSSNLLIYKPDEEIRHRQFAEIPEEIPDKSLIIYNNTKVIHARVEFKKITGARIEVFCLSPIEPVDYQQIFSVRNSCIWSCMVGNLKKWKDGIIEKSVKVKNTDVILQADLLNRDEPGNKNIRFSWQGDFTFAEILEAVGKIPIPPYLNRDTEEIDSARYQTVYSRNNGSVAAPTAGLHFTVDVFEGLKKKNIELAEVTLHVGAGTFQPVKTDNALEHEMHGEQFIVSKKLIRQLLAHNGYIIATGTTTMRTLESIYWLGVKAIAGGRLDKLEQWSWKDNNLNISRSESLKALQYYLEIENKDFLVATTEIMIVPGYDFKVVDAIITNFHQPKSTLLLLISAFIGNNWKKVYSYALNNNFSFLSYGDSSLLFREV